MTYSPRSGGLAPSSSLRVDVLLNTLEHERHARGPLLVALADEIEGALRELAPASTRALLARARRGEIADADLTVLLGELRALTSPPVAA
jgi:hypothetical protein